MIRCKIVDFLLLIPINRMRSYLIENHVLQCPKCLRKLASASEARSMLIKENSPETNIDLWPSIEKKLYQLSIQRKSSRSFPRQWSFAAAGLLILLVSGVIVFYSFFSPDQKKHPLSSGGFQIQQIKVQNQPANLYYYQTTDTDFIFVWAEKN